MRNRILGSIAGLAAGAGLAFAQSPPSAPTPDAEPGVYSRMYPDLKKVANGSPDQPVEAVQAAPAPMPSRPAAVRYVEIPSQPSPVRPMMMPLGQIAQVDAQAAAPASTTPVAAAPCCNTCVDHFSAAREMHGWADAEFLLWRITNGPAPVLASTGDANNAGVLGAGGTPVGLSQFDYGQITGLRVVTGGWLNCSQTIGMDGEALYLSRVRDGFTVASDANGNPVLSRPFFDTNIPGNNVLILALPGFLAGRISVESANYIEGGDGNLVFRLVGRCNMTIDALLGFRYLDIQEDLKVTSSSRLVGTNAFTFFNTVLVTPPAELTTYDQFTARNQFYGGQVGTRAEWCCDRWVLKATAKLGVGVMQEIVRAAGATTLFSALPAPMTVQGGLLAVGSNSVTDTRNQFAFVPEVGLKLGYKLTNKLTATAGYNVLYASSVARPGDQVDGTINPALIPQAFNFGVITPPVRPLLAARPTSDFMAYGATFGLTYEF